MDRNEVYSELKQELMKIPVVDIHQHLDPSALAPRSIDDIVFYHYLVTELVGAGMPRDLIYSLRGVERLKAALKFFKFVRNTATFWCLRKILRDLYNVDLSEISNNNMDIVVKALESGLNNEERARDILRNRVPVYKSFLTLNPLESLPSYDKDIFVGALRMDSLFNLSAESVKVMEELCRKSVGRPSDLRECVLETLDRFHGVAKALTINLQTDDNFFTLNPVESQVEPYLKAVLSRNILDDLGRRILYSYIFQTIVEYARERNLVVQLMVGVKRPVPGADPHDYAITVANPKQVLDLAVMFARYPDVKFDVLVADATLNHMLTVVAKNYPNVFLSGYWWYSMYPETIRSYLRMRIQMLPYNKIGGFFSDAYVADWVYGKAYLAKTQIAHVLTEMIVEGFIERSTATDIGRALLYENAKSIYNF